MEVSILIPTLGREEGLKRCLRSIEAIDFPTEEMEVLILSGEDEVPSKIKKMEKKANGKYIVFASNDTEFEPSCLKEALECSKREDKALVSFNTGDLLPDEGNICEHFLIRRDFIDKLENGEIFSTDFHHVGCDNWLWEQAKRLSQAIWCEKAKMKHHHFSKGAEMDAIYTKGWKHAKEDRETLEKKLWKLKST